MLKVIFNYGQGDVDYTQYVVDGSISIQRGLNTPSSCSLSMVNYDRAFVMPPQRSYMRIYSTKYQRTLYSGFLTNDAAYNYQTDSVKAQQQQAPPAPTRPQQFQYDLTFTSDEYLLQLKAVPFIPAFVNQTQGQILQQLAEVLCPGYFDYAYVASGQLVPYLLYNPTTSWSEYAKQFGDASNYRYSVVDRQIHFQPYNDGSLGIVYDESKGQGTFDPTLLQTQAMTTPIVNDVTIIGSQEGGNNHEDYFMGDGFTGSFPLRHQVFNAGGQQGSAQSGSGSVIVSDDWNETSFNTQNWTIQDPTNAFNLIDGALNITSAFTTPYGESYIQAANGLELAGGLILQHGEFTFNDSSTGIVGGVYDDATLNPDTCETGFLIQPTTTVIVTASGASGISIQPFRQGAVPFQAFDVVTKVNKTYVLSTIVSSPSPVRYTQIYTTMGGVVFGGEQLAPTVSGNITWQVQETDVFTGFITNYTFVVSGCQLPSFAIYGLINNVRLNLSLTGTTIYTPPLATLNVCSEIGAGLLQPIYISGNQQYTGAYVTPSGGNLPILPGQLGAEQQWPLGSSLQNQSAEIDIGTTLSTLNFYSNDLPGVGTRIRLQSWESQAAVSRVQDPASIAIEAAVVGDDGIRSAIINNLNPLPRCAEDCDAAAQAYITDRVNTFYQGTYMASYLFFKQTTNNIDFYPVCGRFLNINSPARGINNLQTLVTSVTTTVVEMFGEIMNHSISFGPDLYLEKVIEQFVSQPANVLLPQDTVVQPTPQQLAQVGFSYLPDVVSSKFETLKITGTTALLALTDVVAGPNIFYELRSADLNWGKNDNNLLARYYGNQVVSLPRSNFEQVWYLRFVSINAITGSISTSRRSKVLRLFWPLVPSVPAFLYADSSTINCDFNGDIRNIEGIELRNGAVVGTSAVWKNASGAIAKFASEPLGGYTVGAYWSEFTVEDVLPSDAIIIGIYPVIIAEGVWELSFQYMKYGIGLSFGGFAPTGGVGFTNPYGPIIHTTDPMQPAVSFPVTEFTAPSIGTDLTDLLGQGVLAALNSSLGPDFGLADTLNISAVGFAVVYESATPVVSTQIASPVALAPNQGLAWALPLEILLDIPGTGTVAGFPATILNPGTPGSPGGDFTYYDGIVGSEFDMMLNLDSLRGNVSANASVIGGPVGSFMKGKIPLGGQNSQTVVPTVAQAIPTSGLLTWVNAPGVLLTGVLAGDFATAPGTAHSTRSYGPLAVSGLFFAGVPDDVTLDGIEVNFDFGFGGAGGEGTLNAVLTYEGIPISEVKSLPTGTWPTGYTLGGPTDLWGMQVGKLTPAHLAGLGVLFTGEVTLLLGFGGLNLNNVSVGVSYYAAPQRNFNVYFFNLMWEYSPPLTVYIPPPPAPIISEGFRWGSALQVNVAAITRPDILFTTLQLSTFSGAFATSEITATGTFNNPGATGIFYQAQTNGAPASFAVNVPVTGDIWAQVQFQDHISAGPWSSILHIPMGNLIASDYLGAQGSTPPTITNGDAGSGGIIGYFSANATNTGPGATQPYIQIYSAPFAIQFPNSSVVQIPAFYATYTMDLDTGAPLVNTTPYGFFPGVVNPLSPNPQITFNGPWLNYTGSTPALQAQFVDGTTPLVNGAFVAQTADTGPATAGGYGVGTSASAGGQCASSDRYIELANGIRKRLREVVPGNRVRTPSGKGATVTKTELLVAATVCLETRSGLKTVCSLAHVLRDTASGMWMAVGDMLEGTPDEVLSSKVWTEKDNEDPIVKVSGIGDYREICRIHLDGDEHVYNVDGFWAHNVLVKNG